MRHLTRQTFARYLRVTRPTEGRSSPRRTSDVRIRDVTPGLNLLVPLQHAEIDRARHRLIGRVVWVQIVAAVVFGLDVAGPRRIARQCVEVDDAVELAACPDYNSLRAARP